MNLNIDPDTINRYVADAIIGSTIGDAIKAQIEEAIKSLTSGYDNPLKKIIHQQVFHMASEAVKGQYAEQIKAAIAEKMAEHTTEKLVNAVIMKAFDEILKDR